MLEFICTFEAFRNTICFFGCDVHFLISIFFYFLATLNVIQVIVFCTTAMMTSLMFSLFHEMKMNVREIHSRKPQLYRTRISDEFKETKRVILRPSDVSARGMNYPDVTLVIQVYGNLESL